MLTNERETIGDGVLAQSKPVCQRPTSGNGNDSETVAH